MAKTIADARANYDRKAATAATNYNNAKGRMAQNYGTGMSKFLGSPVSASRVTAYQSGIQGKTITFDGAKWQQNFVAKMTGQ